MMDYVAESAFAVFTFAMAVCCIAMVVFIATCIHEGLKDLDYKGKY